MCGRGRCTLRPDDIPRACHLNHDPVRSVDMDRYRPSYNVSPGSYLPVVRREDGPDGQGAVLHCIKWGLIPSFTKKTAKPNHYTMFNARTESIYEKPSFRRLVPNNRCLVAVEGFYEWKKDGSKKQPYYIHLKDGQPIVFAALYDSWRNSEGVGADISKTILRRDSLYLYYSDNFFVISIKMAAWMPVILGDKGSTDTWLNGSSSTKFDMLLKPYEGSDLAWYPVTPAVGKPSFDGPECIKEIQLKNEEKPISKFFSTKGGNVKDSDPKDKSSSVKSVKTNLPKSTKEEPETEGKTGLSSLTEEGDHDSKSDVTILPQEGAAKRKMKQDYEEFSTDSKPAIDEMDKPSTNPVRKKGSHKNSGDNQPTLTSYFGKK